MSKTAAGDRETDARELDSQLRPGDIVDIVVSEVISPSNFYFQLRSVLPDLEELKENLLVHYAGSNPRHQFVNVTPGTLVAVEWEEGEWCRGEVKRIKTVDTFEVYFFDYGSKIAIRRDELRSLLPRFASLPPMAHKAKLWKVHPAVGDQWPRATSKTFNSMVDKLPLVAQVMDIAEEKKDLVKVEFMLYDTESNDLPEGILINDLLVEKGLARFWQEEQEQDLPASEVGERSTGVLTDKLLGYLENQLEDVDRIPYCMLPSIKSLEADLKSIEEGNMTSLEKRQVENRAIGLVLRIVTENLAANIESTKIVCSDSGVGSDVNKGTPSDPSSGMSSPTETPINEEYSNHTTSIQIGSEIHKLTFVLIKNKYWLAENLVYQLIPEWKSTDVLLKLDVPYQVLKREETTEMLFDFEGVIRVVKLYQPHIAKNLLKAYKELGSLDFSEENFPLK